jgi:signal transduction histidine kinase
MQTLTSGKRAHASNYYYVRRDGSRFPVLVTTTPLPPAVNPGEDTAPGVIVFFSDISSQKEISRAKSEFIATASHQLRTPIASMNLQLEVFLRSAEGLTPEHREELEDIYATQQSLMELVNRLLQTSRLELGRFAIAPEPLDLQDCLEDASAHVAALLAERKVHLRTQTAGEPIMVNADRKLVGIILDNLLSNAIKYSKAQGVVEISLEEVAKGKLRAGRKVPGDGVLISVKDNGIGIPKEEQQSVFRRLFRTSTAHQSDSGGSGLGLYMVRSILDYSGGNIWFSSREGKGCTFVVWIPKEGMRTRVGNTEL